VSLIVTYSIQFALCINSDPTGGPLTPCSNFTRAPEGAKEDSAAGYGDKQQITAMPPTVADGTMLPLQWAVVNPVLGPTRSKTQGTNHSG
jgi:hypothetical protein